MGHLTSNQQRNLVQGSLRLAALQSEAGKELLQRVGREPSDLSSIVLVSPASRNVSGSMLPKLTAKLGCGRMQVTEDDFYIKSDAILRIGRELNVPFWVLSTLLLPLPHFLRDTVYDQVSTACI